MLNFLKSFENQTPNVQVYESSPLLSTRLPVYIQLSLITADAVNLSCTGQMSTGVGVSHC